MAKKKLLIYDDELDILEVMKIMLSKEYDVVTRSNVTDVIGEVLDVNPDLILMDIWIPEIGGDKAVASLKNDERTQGIPIVYFSANTEIERYARESGADGFISKPFDMKKVKECLTRLIENSQN
ncbi:MAG: response regulator [Flavobacteriales bacterium]|nr:response regulator [Flavobacteriales bacterium]